MSTAHHTPGLWRAIVWCRNAVTTIVSDTDPAEPTMLDEQEVMQYGHTEIAECNGSLREGGDEANAARIVACVNYCAGVPAERLTEDSLEIKLEHIDRLAHDVVRLQGVCGSLLAAAQQALHALDDAAVRAMSNEQRDAARDALTVAIKQAVES